MAVYRKASRLVVSDQRNSIVTEVDSGDEIDFVEILGRPARRIKIVLSAATVSASFRLNNKIVMPKGPLTFGLGKSVSDVPEDITVVSEGAQFPLYTLAGDASYYTEEGLAVSFLKVDTVTMSSGGTDVTIYCW